MVTTALVPARGGSKGLPDKNLMEIGGRSLVRIAVELAASVDGIDEVVVSSDHEPILEEARRAGAEISVRDPRLATDTATTAEVVADFLAGRPHATRLVLLQPTSPLRNREDVSRCLSALEHASSAATVTPLGHPVEWVFRIGPDGVLRPTQGEWDDMPLRRQDCEPAYQLNGAVFAATADHLRAGLPFVGAGTVPVVMPAERSVDIDDRFSLELARALWGDR